MSIRTGALNTFDFPRYIIIAALLLLAAGIWGLRELLALNPLTAFGLLLIPFTLNISKGDCSNRYLLPALIFCALALFSPVTTFAYFAWIFTFFLLIERFAGRLSILSLFIAVIASPVFSYALNIFEFSLRLQLTSMAGSILSFISPATVEGNIINFDGDSFSVDPACAGLNLTIAALLIGVIFLFVQEKGKNSRFSFWFISLVLSLIFILNIIANLLRILMLVFFDIPAEDVVHAAIGIICLLVYVGVPAWFLIKSLASRFGRHTALNAGKTFKTKAPVILSILLTSALMVYAGLRTQNTLPELTDKQIAVKGYMISTLPNYTFKIENEGVLIYLKRIKGFYSAEHNPSICWTGSGYSFEKVREIKTRRGKRFEGILVKGNDILYTAWWYDNGLHKTTDQWKWRWAMLNGEPPYYLTNITAATRQSLHQEISLFENNRIAEQFQIKKR